jgi:hypothetical protein
MVKVEVPQPRSTIKDLHDGLLVIIDRLHERYDSPVTAGHVES